MTKGKRHNKKINSSYIRFGRRTYFFDVNQAENEKKYLKITESQFMGEGKERVYNSFLLLPEDIALFEDYLKEMSGLLTN